MVGVGIIIAIGNSRQHTKLFAVFCRKLTGKSFRRSSQYAVIMLILFGILISAITNVSNNPQAQFLRKGIFAMMFAGQCYQTFCQTNESNTQCSLVDHRSDRIIRF